MKRYVGIIFGIVAFAAAAWMGYSKYKTKMVEAERSEDAAQIQHDYLERVGWIRSNPDDKSYREEVGTFFRWYFTAINEHLNRFHGNREFDGYLAELDKKKGGKEPAAGPDRRAYFEYVKKTFDAMREGKYQPLFTATDKGMRFDVASASVQTVDGKPQIRFEVVAWGPQREWREEGRVRKMVTSATFNAKWSLFLASGKLFGEISASGDPAMKVDFPERFIPEFPPQMVLGHYDLDLVPADVARMEIAFNLTSRAPSGGEAAASYLWKLDTPAEWKMRAGEKWEGAQESVRPEEEIDPAAAAKAAKPAGKPTKGQARK